ncbi:MAG: ABC transporter substrate-binding protein [Actinobacteria bacterium]|nr:ABC transporter substrate-binding protein [Actinomycetota bacterium]
MSDKHDKVSGDAPRPTSRPVPASPTAASPGSHGQWFVVALGLAAMLVATIGFATPDREPVAVASNNGGRFSFETEGETTGPADQSGGRRVITSGGGPAQSAGPAAAGAETAGPSSAEETLGGAAAAQSPDCEKGVNAGETDKGVSEREIKFAATIVKTGIAKDFLSDAQFGIEAVRRRVNAAGGICGRQITIDYQDDGWDPSTGQRIIESWISSNDYFGLAVNPSSEGLRGAIDSGLIDQSKFPVVGADGMLQDQYGSDWVWPVATSTASVMRIMADKALEDGAKTFGIVWENDYRFGVEGRDAFVDYVKSKGGTVNSDVGIKSGQNDYGNQVSDFLGKCGGADKLDKCDFLAFLLEPATAAQWKRNGGFGDPDVRPKKGMGAPQPLFLDSFARDCADSCTGLWAWTSFKPPLAPFASEEAVKKYEQELAAVNTNADPNNPHVEGAYVGMSLLVEGLTRLGDSPTREGLRKVLDEMNIETGLGPALNYKASGKYAAHQAQAFAVLINNQSFAGWRYANTNFRPDPTIS